MRGASVRQIDLAWQAVHRMVVRKAANMESEQHQYSISLYF
jgi:hypothetical protein